MQLNFNNFKLMYVWVCFTFLFFPPISHFHLLLDRIGLDWGEDSSETK